MSKLLIISTQANAREALSPACLELENKTIAEGGVVERLFLNRHSISYCSACMICKDNGICFQNRDFDAVLKRMAEADIVAFDTAVETVTDAYGRSSYSEDLTLKRLLFPELTWFPDRRIKLLQDLSAEVRGEMKLFCTGDEGMDLEEAAAAVKAHIIKAFPNIKCA